MPRYKLTIEYDGRPFVGWQRQSNGLSVQEALENALAALNEGARAPTQAAGRTDAGVHARGQVAHVDLDRIWRPDRLREALNAHLRLFPVAVTLVETATEAFEARFSATKRHYLYRILNRRAPPTHERGFVWHVARELDVAAMHEAAQILVGRHDFTTFRAAECQANSPVRTLERLEATREGDLILVRASAQSFLHRQVRSMVGSLEHVGSGRWRAHDLRAALDARDRARCGATAPACGLFLTRVDY
ncbi:MAG: tRNA pseudouridine(38-40) synthase TruA [Hyphomicrobiales bacterium]|nr:tRNA pseudouridine(38-40) synthase TruA [Hyphomicrobiales bacterium]